MMAVSFINIYLLLQFLAAFRRHQHEILFAKLWLLCLKHLICFWRRCLISFMKKRKERKIKIKTSSWSPGFEPTQVFAIVLSNDNAESCVVAILLNGTCFVLQIVKYNFTKHFSLSYNFLCSRLKNYSPPHISYENKC